MKNHFLPVTLLTLLLLTFTVGCSGLINHIRIHTETEETLLRAGFKPVPVTAAQEVQLQKFTPGKISTLQRHGKIYFIYPDLDHHQILIGHNSQFMQYNELVTQQLAPVTKANREIERDWEESGVWDNW